jgi:hypothetical protein
MPSPTAIPKDRVTALDWTLNGERPWRQPPHRQPIPTDRPYALTYTGSGDFLCLSLYNVRLKDRLAMEAKSKSQLLGSEELAKRHTTQIFGLAMTAVFVAMLILNAISS